MATQAEKYEMVMGAMRNDGFTRKISVNALKNEIMKVFPVKEGYMFKFHIQNMENLGMIKQTDIVGVFDILERKEE